MPTTEEFLVSIGLDGQSVSKFASEVDAAVKGVASDSIEIPVEVNADQATAAAAALEQQMVEAADATEAAMQRADAAVSELQTGIVAAGVAVAGLTALLGKASAEAQGDEQAFNQLSIAFGKFTDNANSVAQEINETTGRALGTVQQLLAETNLAVQAFGFAGQEAVDVSAKLVRAAIDMQAVSGDDARMILERFRTGLQLSGRALLRYGINLDKARVDAEAFAQGLDVKNLSQYQESQIKLGLIMKDTAKFTGEASKEGQTFTERLADLGDAVNESFGELGVAVNEILAPFLEVLNKSVRGLRDWFKQNPKLTRAIAAFTVTLTGLLASITVLATTVGLLVFAYKQYVAVQAVVAGAQTAIQASYQAATATVVANTLAQSGNTTATAANSAAKLANAASSGIVGKAATTLSAILSISTGQLYANAAAWVSLTRVRVTDFIYNAWSSMVNLTTGLYGASVALFKGRAALDAFAASAQGRLVPALVSSVSSVNAFGTAAAVVATAIAGFKLGGFISEWLGLADAQERVMNGSATLADTIKNRLVEAVLVLSGPIGLAGLAWKKYYEYQKEAIESANADEIKKQVDALDPAKIALYNQYVREGMVDWRALKAAIGDATGQLTRFQFLLGQRGIGKASVDQIAELEGLYDQLSKSIPGFADRYAQAMGRVIVSNDKLKLSLEGAKKALKETQEAYDSVVKDLSQKEIELNIGTDAAKSYADLEKLNSTMELFRQRGAAHIAIIEELNKKQLRATGPTREGFERQISEQEQALEQIKRLNETAAREQARLIDESFKTQLEKWKAGYDAEVKAAEDAKKAIIDIEKEKLSELKTLIDQEINLRKTANERALAFEKRLDDAALRRRDAAQLEIQQLREDAQAALENASNQEARARILSKVEAELRRLASTEEESKQIANELASARRQEAADAQALAEAQQALIEAQVNQGTATEESRKQSADAVKQALDREVQARERLEETQKRVAQLSEKQATEEQLRSERVQKAEEEANKLREESQRQAEQAAERDQRILELQQEKLERMQTINQAERDFETAVRASEKAYLDKVTVLDRMRERMLEIIELQKKFTAGSVSTDTAEQQTGREAGGTLAAAQVALDDIVREQQDLSPATDTFAEIVKASVDSLKDEILVAQSKVQASTDALVKTEGDVVAAKVAAESSAELINQGVARIDTGMDSLSAAVARMTPQSDTLAQKVSEVENIIRPVPDAVNKALDAQTGLANQVERVATSTREVLAGMKTRWNETTQRLEIIEAQIRNLGEGGSSNAAAAGY